MRTSSSRAGRSASAPPAQPATRRGSDTRRSYIQRSRCCHGACHSRCANTSAWSGSHPGASSTHDRSSSRCRTSRSNARSARPAVEPTGSPLGSNSDACQETGGTELITVHGAAPPDRNGPVARAGPGSARRPRTPDNLGVTTYDWISFTTDYGEADGFVAACRGVIARLAPGVRVIDVSHQVPPQDVRRGAGVLAQTVPWLPPAVHLAVIDPGVGTPRRGLCVLAGPSVLVGPDNGLLLPAADKLGGPGAAYELENAKYWQPTVSATFHGRDVFAPVAAHLCTGVEPSALGPALPVDSLVRPAIPLVAVGVARIEAEVQAVDGFGNAQLAATGA